MKIKFTLLNILAFKLVVRIFVLPGFLPSVLEDMLALFDDTQLFQNGRIRTVDYDLPGATLVLREQFFDREEADHFYKVLLENTPWEQRERKMYDKMVLDPRLTAWYGKQENDRWTPELLAIKKKVELISGFEFDSVLLNYYRDGNDSVSWHRDKKPSVERNPPIASVSFGETRPFQVRHKFNREINMLEIPLKHGSFLLMGGQMQDFWEHHIPKTVKAISPRINLTFRITV